jgi:hypothetical protein
MQEVLTQRPCPVPFTDSTSEAETFGEEFHFSFNLSFSFFLFF